MAVVSTTLALKSQQFTNIFWVFSRHLSSDRRYITQEEKEMAVNTLKNQIIGGSPFYKLSKNSQKKLIKSRLKAKALRERQEKRRRLHNQDTSSSIHQYKARWNDIEPPDSRLQQIMKGVKVAIDCSMSDVMSSKEINRLGKQVKMLHVDNIRATKPFNLHLTGLSEGTKINIEIQQRLQRLKPCYFDIHQQLHYEVFNHKDIIYLTPDSTQVLEVVEHDKVYVLGGLVDEHRLSGYTFRRATKLNLDTARLPIDIHMEIVGNKGDYNFHCGLAINQVLSILREIHLGRDWRTVLQKHMPKRKGYVLKNI